MNEIEFKLLPCPFCGSIDLRIVKLPRFSDDFSHFEMIPSHVECLNCGCDGPSPAFVDNVIIAWNERK